MDNSDSAFASGATNQNVFSNLDADPESEVESINESQLAEIRELMPNAQKEVEAIDLEIANTNRLNDFVGSLGAIPTDVSPERLTAKLEARMGYINYLIGRRSLYEQALELAHTDYDSPEIVPAPLTQEISLRALQQPKQPDTPGLWQRICVVFRT